MQCYPCSNRTPSTLELRQHSTESSAYEVLDKCWMDRIRGLFKVNGSTFVHCKAEQRIVSWVTGQIARQIMLHTTLKDMELGQGKEGTLGFQVWLVKIRDSNYNPFLTSRPEWTTNTDSPKTLRLSFPGFSKDRSFCLEKSLPLCLQSKCPLHPGGAALFSQLSVFLHQGAYHTITCTHSSVYLPASPPGPGATWGRVCTLLFSRAYHLLGTKLIKGSLIKIVN